MDEENPKTVHYHLRANEIDRPGVEFWGPEVVYNREDASSFTTRHACEDEGVVQVIEDEELFNHSPFKYTVIECVSVLCKPIVEPKIVVPE